MNSIDDQPYCTFFRRVTGHEPFGYQIAVAKRLFLGGNVILRAPTGAGKTWAAIVPFLFLQGWRHLPTRLIYALPLRTLAQGIFHEVKKAAACLGYSADDELEEAGRDFVTLQTGEQPDDPYFDRGKIIITTYDQVLSGLLCGPYGLSDRLHNINAAAIAGALIVFDEFHLMEPNKAFLTAVAGLYLFQDLCQCVWMTATATQPLIKVICEALDAALIPAGESDTIDLESGLPSVTDVVRDIRLEPTPLSADIVLQRHQTRSIVLVNTVGRAQMMYAALKDRLGADHSNQLILLHSRFFKGDRVTKEQEIRRLFEKDSSDRAILVATQVVEAGLDISCERLHTELCPMNSLVQRAGRCARFPGERGIVHVYPLPNEPTAYLPYPEPDIRASHDILEREGQRILNPTTVAKWVEEAHGQHDADSLRGGWRARLDECLRRIEQNSILRDPVRVADLIREGSDQIRVILRQGVTAADHPGQWEGVNLSRSSLARLLRNGLKEPGWYWTGSDPNPWNELRTEQDVDRAYVVCLKPAAARYSSELGIQPGAEGLVESPAREEPKRPGYAPLHMERWADHALRVAEEAERRLRREGWPTGLLVCGLRKRYGLNPDAVKDTVRACALLHDFGKLQDAWQRWAEAAQKSKDKTYQPGEPMAHTDFDFENREDIEREKSLPVRRPSHAAASAYYGTLFLPGLLATAADRLNHVASACTAAVLSHHGGWLPCDLNLGISKLCPAWERTVAQAIGWLPDDRDVGKLEARSDKRGALKQLLSLATAPEALEYWWPLVALLARTLRLSDQRATAEGGANE